MVADKKILIRGADLRRGEPGDHGTTYNPPASRLTWDSRLPALVGSVGALAVMYDS